MREPRGTSASMLLTSSQAAALVGVSKTTWNRHFAAGLTPRPIQIGSGSVRYWRREELIRWVEAGTPAREQWDSLWSKPMPRRRSV